MACLSFVVTVFYYCHLFSVAVGITAFSKGCCVAIAFSRVLPHRMLCCSNYLFQNCFLALVRQEKLVLTDCVLVQAVSLVPTLCVMESDSLGCFTEVRAFFRFI